MRCGTVRPTDRVLPQIESIVAPFVDECLTGGGIDRSRSRWQAPGRGSASGSSLFPGGVDIRYLRYLVDVLYRLQERTGKAGYGRVADDQTAFMARIVEERHPTWAWGNALEAIGLARARGRADDDMAAAARRILAWAGGRRVTVTLPSGLAFRHFPCGYGVLSSRDAGWTNDLSIFGAGLVWAYDLTADPAVLDDARSFAEFFLQPWRPGALGPDGYWGCGTWHEGIGSWVVGPSPYRGFESTDARADECSWVFSTFTCIDYLCRLHRHAPDPRIVDRCLAAARWTFESCQFDDGAVGITGRDDQWLGMTGNAIHQVALVSALPGVDSATLAWLRERARRARSWMDAALADGRLGEHGVGWVHRTTTTDPLVNVGMQWLLAALGLLVETEE